MMLDIHHTRIFLSTFFLCIIAYIVSYYHVRYPLVRRPPVFSNITTRTDVLVLKSANIACQSRTPAAFNELKAATLNK